MVPRTRDSKGYPIWIAEDGGEIAGLLSLSPFYEGRPAHHATAETGLYVSENHRPQGIGWRLLVEPVRRGPELGLKTLTASGFAHNVPSLCLVEGFGFERWVHLPRSRS